MGGMPLNLLPPDVYYRVVRISPVLRDWYRGIVGRALADAAWGLRWTVRRNGFGLDPNEQRRVLRIAVSLERFARALDQVRDTSEPGSATDSPPKP